MLKISDDICSLLQKANIGGCQAKTDSLKDDFHYELLKYSAYLCSADTSIQPEELQFIHQYLNIPPQWP